MIIAVDSPLPRNRSTTTCLHAPCTAPLPRGKPRRRNSAYRIRSRWRSKYARCTRRTSCPSAVSGSQAATSRSRRPAAVVMPLLREHQLDGTHPRQTPAVGEHPQGSPRYGHRLPGRRHGGGREGDPGLGKQGGGHQLGHQRVDGESGEALALSGNEGMAPDALPLRVRPVVACPFQEPPGSRMLRVIEDQEARPASRDAPTAGPVLPQDPAEEGAPLPVEAGEFPRSRGNETVQRGKLARMGIRPLPVPAAHPRRERRKSWQIRP
jgi:hypothetical protein